jgi:hypothetical protein
MRIVNATIDVSVLQNILEPYKFTATKYIEPDGSVTLALTEIDLAENGADEQEAIRKMAAGILDYAGDFYKEFSYWARGGRINHIPYVLKALILNDAEKIGELITCRLGEI